MVTFMKVFAGSIFSILKILRVSIAIFTYTGKTGNEIGGEFVVPPCWLGSISISKKKAAFVASTDGFKRFYLPLFTSFLLQRLYF